ncbi:hypothetical protein [Cellulomonas sp. Y8]|uniref:hypothetical protein n=1 Tax=Cellulomonas sp. Y8 TaxID=2591145 RepID=UPI003D70E8E0
MANYRVSRIPDDQRFDADEVLAGPFDAPDDDTAARIGDAAVRKQHVLYKRCDYVLELEGPDGEWHQVGILDTTTPGLDGTPHEWAVRDDSAPIDGSAGRTSEAVRLNLAIEQLNALPPEEVRAALVAAGLPVLALDTLVDLARQAEDPQVRKQARDLLRDRGLSLPLAVAEGEDVYPPE